MEKRKKLIIIGLVVGIPLLLGAVTCTSCFICGGAFLQHVEAENEQYRLEIDQARSACQSPNVFRIRPERQSYGGSLPADWECVGPEVIQAEEQARQVEEQARRAAESAAKTSAGTKTPRPAPGKAPTPPVPTKALNLPPYPPPTAPELAHEIPGIEAELSRDRAYSQVWEEGNGEELHLLLTGLSEVLLDSTISTSTERRLGRSRLTKALLKLSAVEARSGHYPEDFERRVREHLAAVRGQPNMGLWRAGNDPLVDFTALAAWLEPENAAYQREVIHARRDGPVRWLERNDRVRFPWLAHERDALGRLALLAELSQEEHRRWCQLRGLPARVRIDPETRTETRTCGCEPPAVQVSRSTFGRDWPFTVDEGCLRCDFPESRQEVVFITGGVRYGVNGMASGNPRNRETEPIWAANPDIPGMRIPIGLMIERGLALCRSR